METDAEKIKIEIGKTYSVRQGSITDRIKIEERSNQVEDAWRGLSDTHGVVHINNDYLIERIKEADEHEVKQREGVNLKPGKVNYVDKEFQHADSLKHLYMEHERKLMREAAKHTISRAVNPELMERDKRDVINEQRMRIKELEEKVELLQSIIHTAQSALRIGRDSNEMD